jgi:hypothetical protein
MDFLGLGIFVIVPVMHDVDFSSTEVKMVGFSDISHPCHSSHLACPTTGTKVVGQYFYSKSQILSNFSAISRERLGYMLLEHL